MKKSLCAAIALASFCGLAIEGASAASLNLTATIRDFSSTGGHPDFEPFVIADDRGFVSSTLGADGKPVYIGGPGTITTHGAANFNQWYNGPAPQTTITLTANETAPGSGIYQYSSNSFFPIDGQLLGNEGRAHNYAFTTEIHTTFTYAAGQTFSFTGDDDVFVFINNKLAIDLGGIHGAESASVNLDTLSLVAGLVYTLDIFHAERHTFDSNFSFTTSAVLQAVETPIPAALPLFASGLGALGLIARRRKSTREAV